jgi:hypothetical protein
VSYVALALFISLHLIFEQSLRIKNNLHMHDMLVGLKEEQQAPAQPGVRLWV